LAYSLLIATLSELFLKTRVGYTQGATGRQIMHVWSGYGGVVDNADITGE
jgi:hypothetical protein